MANYSGVSQALRDYSQTYKGGLDEAVASQERNANLLYQGGMEILEMIDKQKKQQFEMQKYQQEQAYRKSAQGRADEALAMQREELEMNKYTNALENVRKLKIAEDKRRDEDLYSNYGGAKATQNAFIRLKEQHQKSKDSGATPEDLMRDFRSLYNFDPRFVLDDQSTVPMRTLEQWMSAHRNPKAPAQWVNKYDKPFESLLTDVKYGMLTPEMLQATKVVSEEIDEDPKKVESIIDLWRNEGKNPESATKDEIKGEIKSQQEAESTTPSKNPGEGIDDFLLRKLTKVFKPNQAVAGTVKPEDEDVTKGGEDYMSASEEAINTASSIGFESPVTSDELKSSELAVPEDTDLTSQDLLNTAVPESKKMAALNNAIEITKEAPDTVVEFIADIPSKVRSYFDRSKDNVEMGNNAFDQLKKDMPWVETSSYDTQKFIALMSFQSSGLTPDKVSNVKGFNKMLGHLERGEKQKAWQEFASSPMFARIYGDGKNERGIEILREMSTVLEIPGKLYPKAGVTEPYIAKIKRDDLRLLALQNPANKITD
tara:strand:+ start:733 stop:2358 length:1626 start_codon:yes stop_codon:yes gene_type:complete